MKDYLCRKVIDEKKKIKIQGTHETNKIHRVDVNNILPKYDIRR